MKADTALHDPFRSLLTLGKAKKKAHLAELAAKEMARHCDARIRRARKALSLIDTFAWSMVSLPNDRARKNLQRRIDAIRETLKTL